MEEIKKYYTEGCFMGDRCSPGKDKMVRVEVNNKALSSGEERTVLLICYEKEFFHGTAIIITPEIKQLIDDVYEKRKDRE